MFVKYLDRKSRVFQELYPDKADWTLTNRLLAMVVNCLRLLLWSKSKDGQKNRKRPSMIGPDMQDKSSERKGSNVKAAPLSQIRASLGRGDELGDKSRKLRNVFGR